MTDGSSQGLFVIVAIVIFGIFVFISYLLFRDTMKPTLANVFCDSFEQVGENTNLLDGSEGKCVGKFNNSHEITSYVWLWFKGVATAKTVWYPEDTSMRTINLKELMNGTPVIEDGYVILNQLSDNGVTVTQEAIDNGFGSDETRTTTIQINDDQHFKYNSINSSASNWGFKGGAKLKIGEVNTIKITYENIYGGKSNYTIQVKIINE
ncbi:hypothetical protein ACQUFD_12935 [Enterococcus gallinarum]|uniref:hypothetical protein n=1 Tax=Enterococcus gallinarum TaxID=1353 RepID=UPI003D0C08F6